MSNLKVGDPVIYVDPYGKDTPALVTAVWGPTCINIVFVSKDENRKDGYGRQTEHESSVGHRSMANNVYGRYFVEIGDTERNPYNPPAV